MSRDAPLTAKDLFQNRALPFIIGSQPFMEDDYIGLYEEANQDEITYVVDDDDQAVGGFATIQDDEEEDFDDNAGTGARPRLPTFSGNLLDDDEVPDEDDDQPARVCID